MSTVLTAARRVRRIAEEALGLGKSVVTANKAMLALHGPRLAALAEDNNATIGWEAAVGGGIPCIKALKEGIAANNITYAAGIMNGAQHLGLAMILPLPLSLEQS